MSLILGPIIAVSLFVAIAATCVAIVQPAYRSAAAPIAVLGFSFAAAIVVLFILVVSRMG